MTKLEEKLIELDYEYIIDMESHSVYISSIYDKWIFWKPNDNHSCTYQCKLRIFFNRINNKVSGCILSECIREQYQIDCMQFAYNQLQKDLEELKEWI